MSFIASLLYVGLVSCSIVYYYNGAQRYEQFLQVGQLYWALILLGLALLSSEHLCVFLQFLQVIQLYRTLILLGLALLSSEHLCVFGLHGAVQILKIFCLHPSLYLLVS